MRFSPRVHGRAMSEANDQPKCGSEMKVIAVIHDPTFGKNPPLSSRAGSCSFNYRFLSVSADGRGVFFSRLFQVILGLFWSSRPV